MSDDEEEPYYEEEVIEDEGEPEEESWADGVKKSFACACLGIFLFFGSFPLLYWNEGRAVARYDALNEGSENVVSINATVIDSSTNGKLVYISADVTTTNTSFIIDPTFGVVTSTDLKLERNVEMYQWEERKTTKNVKQSDGKTVRRTEYNYDKTWSSTLINSGSFNQKSGHENPSSMPYSSDSWNADTIYAGVHVIPQEIVNRIDWYTPYTNISMANIPDASLRARATMNGNNGFYIQQPVGGNNIIAQQNSNPQNMAFENNAPAANTNTSTSMPPTFSPASAVSNNPGANPTIGDIRINFETVQPGRVSIVAQQEGNTFTGYETANGDTLLFFRRGHVTSEEIFEQATTNNKILTWILRFVGLFIMWLGIDSMLHPLEAFMDFIPCLGDMMSAAINLVALVFTFIFGGLTIAIAWLIHHPIIGLIVLVVFGILIGGLVFGIKQIEKNKPKKKRVATKDDDDEIGE